MCGMVMLFANMFLYSVTQHLYRVSHNHRSHFHGSLQHPRQATTSLHTSSLPMSSHSTALPSQATAASSHHSRASSTSTDGTPSHEPQSTTFSSSVPAQKESIVSAPPSLYSHSVSVPEEDIICMLCDEIVDVQLKPCNHFVLCSTHAKTSKKCPQCRVSSVQVYTGQSQLPFFCNTECSY